MTERTHYFYKDDTGISWAFDMREDRHDRVNRNLARKLNAKRSELPEFQMEATTELIRLFVPGSNSNFNAVLDVLVR